MEILDKLKKWYVGIEPDSVTVEMKMCDFKAIVGEMERLKESAMKSREAGLREAAGDMAALELAKAQVTGFRSQVYTIIEICEAYQNNDVECDVEECYQLSKDVIRAANGILATIPPPPNIGEGEQVCEWVSTGDGRYALSCGEWHVMQVERSDSCPHCHKPIKVKE